MSSPDVPIKPKRDNLWRRLKHRIIPSSDASLRESLEGVIESHGAQNGGDAIKAEAKSMMLNLIAFGDLRVDDVMVPRADIIAVEDGATVRKLLDRFIEANHSRLPVFRETLDDLVGMVHIKDFMRWMSVKGTRKKKKSFNKDDIKTTALSLTTADMATTVKQAGFMRELLFVPPSMPASDLLVKMQSSHIHMAIVVDEYGGTDGLVSIEDLVEEIVGDISDEHDTDEDNLIKGGEGGVYVADARVGIDKLEELLAIDFLPDDRDEEADTLGGLIFTMLGRVPARGELIKHESGIEFEVLESDPRRVKRLRIHTHAKVPKPEPAAPFNSNGDDLVQGG
jgi:CBS domain containing-hemolysin-like protein